MSSSGLDTSLFFVEDGFQVFTSFDVLLLTGFNFELSGFAVASFGFTLEPSASLFKELGFEPAGFSGPAVEPGFTVGFGVSAAVFGGFPALETTSSSLLVLHKVLKLGFLELWFDEKIGGNV